MNNNLNNEDNPLKRRDLYGERLPKERKEIKRDCFGRVIPIKED